MIIIMLISEKILIFNLEIACNRTSKNRSCRTWPFIHHPPDEVNKTNIQHDAQSVNLSIPLIAAPPTEANRLMFCLRAIINRMTSRGALRYF